jgi:hypothetical protein
MRRDFTPVFNIHIGLSFACRRNLRRRQNANAVMEVWKMDKKASVVFNGVRITNPVVPVTNLLRFRFGSVRLSVGGCDRGHREKVAGITSVLGFPDSEAISAIGFG